MAAFDAATPAGPLSLQASLHWTEARRSEVVSKLAKEKDANASARLLHAYCSEIGGSASKMATEPAYFMERFKVAIPTNARVAFVLQPRP